MAVRLENRVPPPLVGLSVAALMWVAAWLAPAVSFELPWRVPLAITLAVVGGLLDLVALGYFLRARTTVNPLDPGRASALVETGIYRFTRNPMYLGMATLLLAWAVVLANIAALAVLPAFVLYITRFQIEPEERALAARFGADYSRYCARVRRWL